MTFNNNDNEESRVTFEYNISVFKGIKFNFISEDVKIYYEFREPCRNSKKDWIRMAEKIEKTTGATFEISQKSKPNVSPYEYNEKTLGVILSMKKFGAQYAWCLRKVAENPLLCHQEEDDSEESS
jgi:hypothetical protein